MYKTLYICPNVPFIFLNSILTTIMYTEQIILILQRSQKMTYYR